MLLFCAGHNGGPQFLIEVWAEMMLKVRLDNFRSREFYLGYDIRRALTSQVGDPFHHLHFDQIAFATQVLSILRYFDVPDDELRARSMGYFDGSWTLTSRSIAHFFGFSLSEVVNTPHHRLLGPSWRCPGCDRTKLEMVRRSQKTGKYIYNFAYHHDHMLGDINAFRFDHTSVCVDCNNLDTAFKSAIVSRAVHVPEAGDKIVYPQFSFSPEELRYIVDYRPPNTLYKPSEEDVYQAASIYNDHFAYGLAAFQEKVRNVHREYIFDGKPIEKHKLPFLRRWGIAESVVDAAVRCVVDGVHQNKPMLSHLNGEEAFILEYAETPISEDLIDAIKSEFGH